MNPTSGRRAKETQLRVEALEPRELMSVAGFLNFGLPTQIHGSPLSNPSAVAINGFHLGAVNPLKIGPTMGTVGKGLVHTFTITRPANLASPNSLESVNVGDPFQTIVVDIRKATSPALYSEFQFKFAHVTSISWSGGGQRPTETVVFAYQSVELVTAPYGLPPTVPSAPRSLGLGHR